MIVCEFCGDEPIYEDRDEQEAYCQDCYEHLDKEYIEAQGVKKF